MAAPQNNNNMNSPTARVSIQKYDDGSNEIIALVNVPNNGETVTLESAVSSQNHANYHHHHHHRHQHRRNHYHRRVLDNNNNLNNSNNHSMSQYSPPLSKNLSKSESRLDSWRLWPDYTVEQETDTSIMSNVEPAVVSSSGSWIKAGPNDNRPSNSSLG